MERKKINLPKQCLPRPQRTASAPYNFIPLPEKVVRAVNTAEDLPDHDRYVPGRYTGYFEVLLTTKSPLYIRCPLTREEFERQETNADEVEPSFRRQVKNTPHFFYTQEPTKPVIPGSSLRGMLRSVLEIVSYGKMQWVTGKRLFFRTVDNTAVGCYYRKRMVGKVEAGFLQRKGRNYIIKTCQVARIHHSHWKLRNSHPHVGRGPNQVPCWQGIDLHQWARVWVKLDKSNRYVQEISLRPQKEWPEGILVITGHVPHKKKEFVFLLPPSDAEEIIVPEEIIKRFHDEDQITMWQERAFPVNQPTRNCRERPGMLRKNPVFPGDPVFFLREEGRLAFLGRAQMFRLPYVNGPLNLVPSDLRRPEDIDYSEALLGFVRSGEELKDMLRRGLIEEKPRQGDKMRAYAGRVYVTDGVLLEGQKDVWLAEEPVVPKILASPKPSAFQHYLVQASDEQKALYHYDSATHDNATPQKTVIRGHKRYWLQGERGIADIQEDDPQWLENGRVRDSSTQHTQLKPVKAGVRFKFRIYFENLNERELGALCWALHPLGDPDKEYCHQLGMGKPLGMGAVQLESTLYIVDPSKRYSALFEGEGWQTGLFGAPRPLSHRQTLEELTAHFERHILESLGLGGRCRHLYELKRVAMLLKMMEWPGYPAVPGGERFLAKEGRPNTRYMRVDEFKGRPVLPDPSAFGRLCGNVEP